MPKRRRPISRRARPKSDEARRLQALSAVNADLERLPPFALVDTATAALLLARSVRTLELWRLTGKGGPAWHRIGRRCGYSVRDLKAFIDAHRVAA